MTGIQAIKQMVNEFKAEGYYTGLYVTNLLNGEKHTGYISIVVRRLPIATIVKNLEKHGEVTRLSTYSKNLTKDTQYPIEFKAHNDPQVYKIRLPRVGKKRVFKKSGTLEEDSKHSDFTITSMYLPIG